MMVMNWRAADLSPRQNAMLEFAVKLTEEPAKMTEADRQGLRDDAPSKSWNSSHPSRGSGGGCTQADLRSTGGDGLLYCFAAN